MKNETKEMICICCPIGCNLKIEKVAENYLVSGNKCPRGNSYGIEETIAPKRTITSTVKIKGGLYPMLPVKTSAPIAKALIFEVMKILSHIEVAHPVKTGDIIISNVANTGIDIVATKNS